MSSEVVSRLRMRLDRENGLANLDKIVEKYGRVEGEAFTFTDHEFQRKIIQDTSARISVRKCSQVGLSELMVQKTLAMCASLQHTRIIFTLPTDKMATSFSKDRIDGVIEQSDFYSGLVQMANNSASQKKIGSNVLYISGTFGSNSAISIPAEVIISDEIDFSSPIVLGKLNSRLRHAKSIDEFGNRGMRFNFSTPTVDGFGIDEQFKKGDQKYYQVKCICCNTWQIPMFNTHFRIPGYAKEMATFDRADAYDLIEEIEDTKIHCEKCDADLMPSLSNPDQREWVSTFQGKTESSYQVLPTDVIKYNTPAAIAKQIMDYPLKSDWVNFTLGLPYSDANNSFIVDEVFKRTLRKVDPLMYLASIVSVYTVMGLDTGRLCYMTIAMQVGRKIHVLYTEVIPNTRNSPAAPEVIKRYDFYRCVFGVVDSMPDITLANTLTQQRDMVAAVYVRDIKGAKFFEMKPNDAMVNVARTKSLTYLLDKHNGGDVLYPKNDAMTDTIFKHMGTTHKLRKQNMDGSFDESFVASSTEDHALHSLNYAMVAIEHKFGLGMTGSDILAPVSIGCVQLGANHAKENEDPFKKYQVW